MNKDLELELNENHPELFFFHVTSGRGTFHFECGDGWFNILNALFGEITYNIRYNNDVYNKLMEAQDMIDNGYEDEAPPWAVQRLTAIRHGNGTFPEEQEFPVVQQVKEKFGTLNVYVKNADGSVLDLIGFAERMSATTCEECGNVGKKRGGGWVKTLCDKHHKKREKERLAREKARDAWMSADP